MEVSVVIPLLNERESLKELSDWIVKVMRSNHFSYEILFIDDGSTDGSMAVIRKFETETDNVTVIDQPNGGASVAMNSGVAAAGNYWIKPVDADDLLAPDATERLLSQAEATGCRYIYGRAGQYPVEELDATLVAPIGAVEARIVEDRMTVALRHSVQNPTSMLIAADLYREVGGCDPRHFPGSRGDTLINGDVIKQLQVMQIHWSRNQAPPENSPKLKGINPTAAFLSETNPRNEKIRLFLKFS